MRDFIYNCLLFQSSDIETNIIGGISWIFIITFFVILFFPQIFIK
jgi:hypothetical protein